MPYKNVNEKLLHLSDLLSIGSTRDTYRQGMLQEEEDSTLFKGAQSQARQNVDTLNNRDKNLGVVLAAVEPLLLVTPLRSKRKTQNQDADKKRS